MIAQHVVTRPSKYGDELMWETLDSPPFLINRGKHAFLIPPRRARAYVNGIPVVGGIQAVQSGDLVCVVEDGADIAISYRVEVGHASAEPGQGRPCAFTGRPITGMAVRCAACDRVVHVDVAREIENCPACGSRFLTDGAHPEGIAEELL